MNVDLLTRSEYVADMERVAALAALTCRGNADKEFVPSEVLGRIIKAGHESILEHINLTYSVKGLSRACLQELARHRHISLSVESTRHTLKKYLQGSDEAKKIIASVCNILPAAISVNLSKFFRYFEVSNTVDANGKPIHCDLSRLLLCIAEYVSHGAKREAVGDVASETEIGTISNDELKYYIPEFWPTNLVLTSNVRELRHILKLRTAPAALKEFRQLARAMYEVVPEQFKYLLKECVHDEANNDTH